MKFQGVVGEKGKGNRKQLQISCEHGYHTEERCHNSKQRDRLKRSTSREKR